MARLTAKIHVVIVVRLVDGFDLSADIKFLDFVIKIFDRRVLFVAAKH